MFCVHVWSAAAGLATAAPAFSFLPWARARCLSQLLAFPFSSTEGSKVSHPNLPFKAELPSLRASRIRGQRLFNSLKQLGGNLHRGGFRMTPGSPSTLTDPSSSTLGDAVRGLWPNQMFCSSGWKFSLQTASCLALEPLNRVGCRAFSQTEHQRS